VSTKRNLGEGSNESGRPGFGYRPVALDMIEEKWCSRKVFSLASVLTHAYTAWAVLPDRGGFSIEHMGRRIRLPGIVVEVRAHWNSESLSSTGSLGSGGRRSVIRRMRVPIQAEGGVVSSI